LKCRQVLDIVKPSMLRRFTIQPGFSQFFLVF
jgi:hypothetical protein